MSYETVVSYQCQWKVTGINRRPTHQNWVKGELRLQTNQKSWRCALTVGCNPRCDPFTYHLSREMTDFSDKLRVLINLKDGVTIHVRDITDHENADLISKLNMVLNGKTEVVSHKQSSPFSARDENCPRKRASPSGEFTKMKDSGMTRRERMQAEAREDTSRETRRLEVKEQPESGPSREFTKKTPNKFLENSRRKSEGALGGVSASSFYSSTRSLGPSLLSSKTKRSPGLLNMYPEKQRPKFTELSNKSPTYTWSSRTPSSPSPRSTSLQGFSNLGNTCYMNAILQSLFGLDTFSSDLMYASSRYYKDVSNDHRRSYLSFMLSRLLQAKKREGTSTDHKKQILAQVKRTISSTAKRFSGYEQHDAHEFLGQILDQLKDEFHKLKRESSQTASNGEVEVVGSAQDQSPGVSTEEDSPNPTRDNFEFKVSHEITCLDCYDRLETLETFHDLSIDMPPRKALEPTRTIQDALDHFFLPEELEYTCEQCGAKQAKVQHKFVNLPRVLILHLKRYAYNSVTSSNTKLGQSIIIPKYLTLKGQCEEHTQPAPPSQQPYNFSKADHSGLHVVHPFTPSFSSKMPQSRLTPAMTSPTDMDISPDNRRSSTSRRKLDLGGEEPNIEGAEPKESDLATVKAAGSEDSLDWVLKLSKETATSETKSRERLDSLTVQTMSEEEMIKLAMERSMLDTSGVNSSGDTPSLPTDCPEVNQSNGTSPSHNTNPNEAVPMEEESEEKHSGINVQPSVSKANKWEPPSKRSRLDDHSDSAYSSFTEDSTDERSSAKQESEQPEEPDTHRGVGDDDGNSQEDSAKKPVHIDLSLSDEENKENYTPVRSPSQEMPKDPKAQPNKGLKLLKEEEFDEEAQLRQAIANSLKDQEQLGQQQDVELEKAKELSLQDNTPGKLREEPPREVRWNLKRTKEEERVLSRQAEQGDLPYSYQLVSVVSHLGSSSSLGHYISDVYDPHKRAWLSWDDSHVNRIQEEDVRKNRERSGYIYFYVCKDTVQELEEFYYQQRRHNRSQSINSLLPTKKVMVLPGSASKSPSVQVISSTNATH